MFLARSPLFLVAVIGLLCPEQVTAEAVDDAQVAFNQDNTTEDASITGDLPDLLHNGIWVEENKTGLPHAAWAAASRCCTILAGALPGQVLFPSSAKYHAQQSSYYSREQSELSPSCRVLPASALDVSTIIVTAKQYNCVFAVRSGGHAMADLQSNVDATGFTIDLQKMDQISVLDEEKTVSFGAGCRWQQVYAALQPYNRTTAGGRVPEVGVSGFLLGGGISALSLAHGFGSSNVVNYQIVLADGSIQDVNQQTLPDLYWALKYGSTNFGIVTRFEMTTYPLGDVWGGLLVLDISRGPALLQFHVEFAARLAADPTGLNIVVLAWEPVQKTYVVWSPNLYLSPVAFPPLYSGLEAFAQDALVNTLRITDLLSVTGEFQAAAAGHGRVYAFTLTLKADAALLWDSHLKGVEIFEPYLTRAGLTWSTIVQPMNRGFAAASVKNGGHPSGIAPDDGDLVVFLVSALWSEPADDGIIKEKMLELMEWVERTARARGLLHPFIYMNYASGQQDVMGGIGAENLQRMRRAKTLYDPENQFGKYWKGGFKL
ncbi:hypothetical protein B0H15DRAFT_138774 [Mycena belliarum]|uniref:FAD-binding PCMH-type domain-containing protein n=1 Tax=Mycena belliarum TaxID=1033014 RepID=A0AAD6TP07_9AGAR|nr:hypothetical protein B0H15DRAFT_138774 [Mycena belliae]